MTKKHEDLQISLRDLFEASALSGLIAHDGFNENTIQQTKVIAEQMLEARSHLSKVHPNLWHEAEDWVKYRAKDENDHAFYFEAEPRRSNFGWVAQDGTRMTEAPSYSFAGAWFDSLQLRGEA